MEIKDKNIIRFNALVSKIDPLYKAQHKEGDIETMKKLLQKASINEVSVLICGEFKRGKSSFINAFLGEGICPADPGIATSVVSIIRYGTERKVTRFYGDIKNLKSEVVPFDKIEKYAKGTSLEVDNTIMLIIELPSAKIVLNKSDLKSKEELEQLIYDTRKKIVDHCQVEDEKVEIVPVSSLHWAMYNKSQSEKMKTSSNCEAIGKILENIVPEYKLGLLKGLKGFMLTSLSSLIEKYEYQLSQIGDPNPEAQEQYKAKLMELKSMRDDLANPNTPTRKKIAKVIHSTQSNVINELTRQSILFSTDCLDQLLKRPEAKAPDGSDWVLSQLNMGLESIAAEVDQRIQLGFTEVNSILGENVEIGAMAFSGRIDVDLTPAEKDIASKACGFARNALPGMGVATMAGFALSLFCGPVLVGLGALGAAASYVYKTNKDQNTQARIYELKTKLSPQITIVMNDLKAYVQQRFEAFNESLVESFESMTADVVAEMQQVIDDLKNIDADAKAATKLKEQVQEQLNFVRTHRQQVELLLTNPFETK